MTLEAHWAKALRDFPLQHLQARVILACGAMWNKRKDEVEDSGGALSEALECADWPAVLPGAAAVVGTG